MIAKENLLQPVLKSFKTYAPDIIIMMISTEVGAVSEFQTKNSGKFLDSVVCLQIWLDDVSPNLKKQISIG
jgi:hypothetical protein